MDVASVYRFGSSGPGNRGAIRRRKHLPRKRSAAPGRNRRRIRRNLRNRFGKKRPRRLQTYKPGIPRAVTKKLGWGGQPGRRGNGSPFRQIFSNLGGRLQPRNNEPLQDYISEACPSTFRYRFVSSDMHAERTSIAIYSSATARTVAVP